MTVPTPPIDFEGTAGGLGERLAGRRVEVGADALAELAACCAVETDGAALSEHGRDWWPLALHWALAGEVPALPAVVARPRDGGEVARLLAACTRRAIPVTAAGGRSGVCGGAVPVFGGVSLDTTALVSPLEVDDASLLVTLGAGWFGNDAEAELRSDHGLTMGHFPQSIDLATVGGWIACRGAGQYSTRYGKIEDIVAGLEVVLADGRVVRTGALAGAGPRSATGPDLTQLFVGNEGTLGVITRACLRVRPVAGGERRLAAGFDSFAAGIEALRRTLRRGATPAVVRLYDTRESERAFGVAGTNVLVALDEGDPAVVEAAVGILADECRRAGGADLDEALVERWLGHRNDVSALAAVTRAGIVVDTVEVAAPWSKLPSLYEDAVAALSAVDGCLVASAHESHAYLDGACLYFTFAGRRTTTTRDGATGEAGRTGAAVPGGDGGSPDQSDLAWKERFYEAAWTAVMTATRRHGASISHHHGVGLVRGPYLAEALGEGYSVLRQLKESLDPAGVLNPGKLGLVGPFGPVAVP